MNKFIVTIFLTSFLTGCGGSSNDGGKNTKTTGVGSVSGFITASSNGATIPDVDITIAPNSEKSSINGSYILSNISIGSNTISASKSGYMTHTGTVTVSESSATAYDVVLLEKNCVQPYGGLISWWRGDGNANDSVSTNNGQEINGASYVTGLIDQSFSFDGVNDFITVLDVAELNPVSAISVTAWVKIKPNNDHQAIVNKFYGNFNNGANDDSYILMVTSNGGLYWQLETNNGGGLVDNILITTPVVVLDDKFHFLVGTYDGNSMKVFLDGIEIVSFNRNPGAVSGNLINSVGTPVLIGGGSNNNVDDWFVNGLVDEVNLYNVALTDAQILELYEVGAAGVCK